MIDNYDDDEEGFVSDFGLNGKQFISKFSHC